MAGFLDESTRSRPEVVTSEYASGYVDPLQPLAPSGRWAILVRVQQSGKRRNPCTPCAMPGCRCTLGIPKWLRVVFGLKTDLRATYRISNIPS